MHKMNHLPGVPEVIIAWQECLVSTLGTKGDSTPTYSTLHFFTKIKVHVKCIYYLLMANVNIIMQAEFYDNQCQYH